MNPELRQYIEQTRFCRATVETVAGMLPADDAELDALDAFQHEANMLADAASRLWETVEERRQG